MNNKFELLEFVFNSVYVDLNYNKIYLTFTAGYVCLCGWCSHVVIRSLSVRLSRYPMWVWWDADNHNEVTMMCVLLFVLQVSMVRVWEGGRVTAMLLWGTVEVSTWHEYVGGTCGSCVWGS